MAWQACQAWAQNVYDDPTYAKQLDTILAVGAYVVMTRANQPLTASAKSESSPDSAGGQQKTKKPDDATCKAKPTTPGCETGKPADPAKPKDPQKAGDADEAGT